MADFLLPQQIQRVRQRVVGRDSQQFADAVIADSHMAVAVHDRVVQVGPGDDTDKLPLLQHRERHVTRIFEPADGHLERRVGRERHHIARHRLLDGEHAHQVLLGTEVDVDAALRQLGGVNRVLRHYVADRVRNDARQHQRQDNLVVASHLEQQHDGGEGPARRRRSEGGHPHQRVRARRGGEAERCNCQPEGGAKCGAEEQRRREDAAGTAAANRYRSGDKLQEEEHRQQQRHVVDGEQAAGAAQPGGVGSPLQHPVGNVEAVAEDFGEGQRDGTHRQATQCCLRR